MNRTKKLFLATSIAGTLALAASPAAADTYGGTGGNTGGAADGTTTGTGGSGTGGSSTLALTGVDSMDLALGGALLAGSGMVVTWGVRRNRLVA